MDYFKSLTIALLLLSQGVCASQCFDENTTVEDREIGDQIVDVVGCKLVSSKPSFPDFWSLFFIVCLAIFLVGVLVFVIFLVIRLIVGGRNG
jgi:hypothetical protein